MELHHNESYGEELIDVACDLRELNRLRERLARAEALIIVGSRLGDGSPVYLDVRGRDLLEALRGGT